MIGNAIAGFVGAIEPKVVTGGTLSSDATYFYRAFTGTGSLTVSGGTLVADVVCIGGGGGGGHAGGGAGGSTEELNQPCA